jgi:hypothetical protein
LEKSKGPERSFDECRCTKNYAYSDSCSSAGWTGIEKSTEANACVRGLWSIRLSHTLSHDFEVHFRST